jgi:hypothetical protein
MAWTHKPLGQVFMSLYEAQTFAKGVKRCRRLAGLPEQRFQDGTPVYNLRFVPTATTIASALVPQPRDWPAWQQVTGFLMMDGGREDIWEAPADFLAFLARGGSGSGGGESGSGGDESSGGGSGGESSGGGISSGDNRPVYVGFGSMCGDEAMAVHLTRVSLASLQAANQRGVLLGGWAGMTRHRLDPVADKVTVSARPRCLSPASLYV